MRHSPNSQQALIALRARQKRSWLTRSEHVLFEAIRAGKLGVCVRRQVVIGRFIVDFLVPSRRLVIEVDGTYHAQRHAADARRDRALARLGYRVLRLEAELVVNRTHEAVARIREALA